jgi:hypothetical protein
VEGGDWNFLQCKTDFKSGKRLGVWCQGHSWQSCSTNALDQSSKWLAEGILKVATLKKTSGAVSKLAVAVSDIRHCLMF